MILIFIVANKAKFATEIERVRERIPAACPTWKKTNSLSL